MKSKPFQKGRRSFFKMCLSTLSLVGASPYLLAQSEATSKTYNRVKLTLANGEDLTSESLRKSDYFLFNYPYVTTPCFLIDLKEAVDSPMESSWPGGVGKYRSVVCYSAICAHKQTYPARSFSFINFRPEEITYRDRENNLVKRSGLIYCCSERSVYDPSQGAEVLSGPAPVSLTTILLEHDTESDHFYAVGTLGVEQYEAFFDRFIFRVALENSLEGPEETRVLAEYSTIVYTSAEYSAQSVGC
ncbi:MAG: (2Fe-2S)-binding protein [Gammaproteobacteria bacterium]|nr:(2Fe-2S)-binding protein [Gammaproteobacteria bacterium]